MDPDVLAHVLARRVAAEDLMAASITGFRRVGTRAGCYPMLVPTRGVVVVGRLLPRLARRDIERINQYESGEYGAELRTVADGRGRERAAWVYLALDHLQPTGEPWELAAWQARHKAAFFAEWGRWMADLAETACGSNSPRRRSAVDSRDLGPELGTGGNQQKGGDPMSSAVVRVPEFGTRMSITSARGLVTRR